MNSTVLRFLICVFITCHSVNSVSAQLGSNAADAPAIAKRGPDQKIEAMLLSVYHFDTPPADEFNFKVDDYFSEKRQAEIAEVVRMLSEFKPTKVFVEFEPSRQNTTDERFQAFVKNELDLKDLKYEIGRAHV